jgi:octaprenyl-diphosphate synthase
MAAMEGRLRGALDDQTGFLVSAARRVLSGRGKRLRPSLLLLSAEAVGRANETSLALAAMVELAHAASLVHDDVVDGAESRRGRRSANALWGNRLSVLLGDYLVAQAFRLMPEASREWVTPLLAKTADVMCAAQAEELRASGATLSEEAYLRIVRGKTASLLSLSMRLGAASAGGSERQQAALAAYGEAFGVAFQLTDDILDIVGTNGKSGKPEGRDLLQRKSTLPLILARKHAPRTVRAELRKVLMQDKLDEKELARLVELSGAIPLAWGRIHEWLERAEAALAALPESSARHALEAACRDQFPLPVMAGKR